MIRFACPGCAAALSVPDEEGGRAGECPKCQRPFVIPGASPRPAAAGPVEIAPCPGCRARLSADPADLGRDIECPYCKTTYTATRSGPDAIAPPADRPSRRRPPPDEGDVRPSRRRAPDDFGAGDRPRRRPRENDDDPEDRPSRRRLDDDDYDRPSRSRRRKPGGLTAVAGMLLGGGIYAVLHTVAVGAAFFGVCCLWPGLWFGFVLGVLAIIRGAQMLGRDDDQGPPQTLLMLQIAMIVVPDLINCILGIVGLVLLNSEDVERYYRRQGF